MLPQTILSALAAFLVTASAAPTTEWKRGLSFNYNSKKVRGVNLGGWFVLEPWITPSLFESVNDDSVVDEYTLTAKWGKQAQAKMEKHWDSFYSEQDFADIAKAGLNHVRIPVGYWAVKKASGDPYVSGQLSRLDKAITWAKNHNLKVVIDLHGAQGSQNGFDNSGRRGDVDWQTKDPDAKNTLGVIKTLTQRYTKYTDTVTSIQAINEPMGSNNALDMGKVKKYYYDVWGTIRDSNPDTALMIHDAFQDPKDYWNGFMTDGTNNVILDTHQYQVFSNDQVARSPCEHVSAARGLADKLKSTDKWTVVGEWSGALTDCTQWLNGKGKGARYDGTFPDSEVVGSCDGKYKGTVEGLSDADKKNIRSFIEAQLDAYEAHTGWFFWTWKAESAPEWNMKELIKGGLFPQPISDRQNPLNC